MFVRGLGSALTIGAGLPWLACVAGDGGPELAAAPDGGGLAEAPHALCSPFLTSTADFFRQFGGSRTVQGWVMPELDAQASARIEGLVATPLDVRLSDLLADTDHHVTVLKTMMCILGFRSTALFTGVPLRGLLDRAGIDLARAKRVRFFGVDGFENNLHVDDIYAPLPGLFEPLLAFAINDEPLPQALGFPFRLLLNDRFGFKNTKWLARIEVTDADLDTGQYQAAGYPDSGVIATVPAVESHRVAEQVAAGAVELCGFALSGRAGIARVEAAVDGAAFEPCALTGLAQARTAYPELERAEQLRDSARFTATPAGVWSQWSLRIELGVGRHTIAIRAFDAAGERGDATLLELEAAS